MQENLPTERSLESLKTLGNLLIEVFKEIQNVQEVTSILWIKKDLPIVIKILVGTV